MAATPPSARLSTKLHPDSTSDTPLGPFIHVSLLFSMNSAANSVLFVMFFTPSTNTTRSQLSVQPCSYVNLEPTERASKSALITAPRFQLGFERQYNSSARARCWLHRSRPSTITTTTTPAIPIVRAQLSRARG
ncbi:hypothetical protein BDN72DRAFT_384777 [Pluteus cervinus]|uniref:Uncharacterized protein n=1 Tax=Pluteus cervinus TaxID=181527 RepID=A0ACD3AAK8_9AGAR|nr:hypothetical protein BDN72DRAFT_384777 [Pluteus cervinus]